MISTTIFYALYYTFIICASEEHKSGSALRFVENNCLEQLCDVNVLVGFKTLGFVKNSFLSKTWGGPHLPPPPPPPPHP